MANIMYISESYLRQNTLLDENVDNKFLNNAIEQSQVYMKEFVDKCVLAEIDACITSGVWTDKEDYKELLDDYLTNYLSYKVLETICIPLSYKFKNQGLVTANDQHFVVSNIKDIGLVENHYKTMADSFKLGAISFIEEKNLGCGCENRDVHKQVGSIHFRK